MTIKEILQYDRTIKAIVDNSKNVNALIKFKLLGMCKQFEPIIINFQTIRNEKITEYGTEDESGGISIALPQRDNFESDDEYNNALNEYEETMAKFNEELDQILDSEADITIKKFKVSDIMESGISSNYLVGIYDLIEE